MANFITMDIDFVKNNDLTLSELGAYAIMLSYRNGKTNECYPSLATLMKSMKCSKPTVSKALKSLVDKGYLIKKDIYKTSPNGQVYRDSNVYVFPKIDKLFKQATKTQILKVKETPKINQKTFNPDTVDFNEMKKELEEKERQREIDELLGVEEVKKREKLSKIVSLYQKNVGIINAMTQMALMEISETFEIEIFEEAIRIATDRNKLNLGYIKGILNNWKGKNITTIDQVNAENLERSKTYKNDDVKNNNMNDKNKQVLRDQLNRLREANKKYVSTVNTDIKDDSEIEF